MKKSLSFVSKSVAALAMFSALPALAGTATYSGSLCTSVSGFGSPTIYRSGRLINQTPNTIEVVCPIQRNVTAPTFTEALSINVTALDPHLSENVCCTATVAEKDGSTLASSAACSNWGANTANHNSFSLSVPSVFANINGYVSLRCVLPGQYTSGSSTYSSVLASFVVSE
ncbi:hypothetical protein [Corallococcus macrosporus]|uniref:Uncharacterized protein n=2 Tax=Myxococcaceae TaxID=31 RepID=A0A250JNW8_9BACT|nr:hypothetical protein [Corallococcus macrosporus]AEI62756.1 hypothetical protein LILAB_04165 [Corallococcus macrosporus]ATB45348.1 hypothetical protein MYMAC_000933 [Corallococcus macrosporus DSM 14697]